MEDKVYTNEVIQENPFPGEQPQFATTTQVVSGNTFGPTVAKEKALPKKRVAVELLSQVLNTRSRKIFQEFDLEQSGGFRVGNFQEGVSGDVSITPNGLVGRNLAGISTFALDTDGNLVLVGEIRSGSTVTGQVVVGNNRVIIDVDSNGEPTIIVNDGQFDRVLIGFGEF